MSCAAPRGRCRERVTTGQRSCLVHGLRPLRAWASLKACSYKDCVLRVVEGRRAEGCFVAMTGRRRGMAMRPYVRVRYECSGCGRPPGEFLQVA
jgi:hypothetical protein